jgi:hypothetical protein
VNFGFGAFGEREGAVKVAEEVFSGWAFEPGDEAAELAGVAHGVAQAQIHGLQEAVAECCDFLGIGISETLGRALPSTHSGGLFQRLPDFA